MTDETAAPQGAPAPGDAPAGPQMRILAQYVKDLSFENPRAPESLRVEGKPAIDLGVEMGAQGRADGLFEVDLKLSVKATHEEAVLFNIELQYGGLFQIAGVAANDMEPMLLVECPRYLFPFARQIISNCTSEGGFFPPFQLEPLDFAAIYHSRKAQIAQGQA
ncbi:protein-export chaperone SecB [Brevundimonas sp. 2R-24]|uniref:Protein-export protein SecB n=1 Tax=Peiella sedimenti TaxID=3061083 RepID=A0ABT8SKL0_9CAUL|nr:protein-export chaperone SecB [Caulobacteraceae bacterium XZ-24]